MKFLKLVSIGLLVFSLTLTLTIFGLPIKGKAETPTPDVVGGVTVDGSFQQREIISETMVGDTLVTEYAPLPDEISFTHTTEGIVEPDCATCNHSTYTKSSQWLENSDYKFGWHPESTGYLRVSGYWFSLDKKNYSFGVSYGPLSISVSKSGSGYFINADYSRWSRPAIFGEYWVTRYLVKEYSPANILIRTYYQNIPWAQKTYIKILYQ